LTSKYQELSLVRFPDGGYVRSVPTEMGTQAQVKVRLKAAGPVLRVFVDEKELIQYVDQLEL
jgi:hypothetical protein